MNSRSSSPSLVLFLFVCMSLMACDEAILDPTPQAIDDPTEEVVAKVAVSTHDGVTRYDGVTGGENVYALFVPHPWNGDLVVYAHGFIDAARPLELPTNDSIEAVRDRMVASGFAFAYSSYRENGLAVKDGAWATRRLASIFRSTVKVDPDHTWLVGHSLGALIAVELAETHGGEFDGVLSLAGLIGGTAQQLDYVANVRLLFDFFYPGVIPGSVLDVPADYTIDMLIADVVPAVMGDPTGAFLISQIDQTPLPAPTNDALVQSLVTALAFNLRGIGDVLERTHGEVPIDNQDTEYTSASGVVPAPVLGMINAAIPRYDRTKPAESVIRRQYEPTGRLSIPMIAIHRRWDPTVPMQSTMRYAQAVDQSRSAGMLEVRLVDEYGHADFGPDFVLSSLLDLVHSVAGTEVAQAR